MDYLSGSLMLIVFVIGVLLAMKGENPILIFLPMAIVWAALAGTPLRDIVGKVIDGGGTIYASTIVIILFGAWFGQILVQTGIAETLIRTALELAGERPLVVAIAVCCVVGFLSTSMYGIGAIIAMGVITLPIMMAAGVPPKVAACVMSMSVTAAYCMNPVAFATMKPLFNSEYNQHFIYYAMFGSVFFVFTLLMCAFQLRRTGVRKYSAVNVSSDQPTRLRAPWYACLAPLIPALAVVFLKWGMIASFMLGAIFALAATAHMRKVRETVDLACKCLYDAFPDIATVVAIWIMVGMLITAGQLPQVQAALKPIFTPFLPKTSLGLMLFFGLLAPLGLYRGPFIVTGTGAALLAIFLAVGTFPGWYLYLFWLAGYAMAAAFDPTTSWNVWLIGYTRITHRQFLFTGVPFAWAAIMVGMILCYFYTAGMKF